MAVSKCASFVLLLISCGTLAAAAKCGKLSHKASYGKTKTFESSNAIGTTCRYGIRAPKGLHIKFSTNSADSGKLANFTVYDASKKPFRWRQDQILTEVSESDLKRGEINLGTSIIGVEYEGTSLTPQIKFDYSATIPSDNNFGFDSTASTRERVIRTPGFPRATLGSGIRCTWNLKARRSKNAILLVVQGLRTASKRDYIEVYDGDRVLGRISRRLNKLEPNPEFVAYSGRMKVYLHTETPGSKGFKATYKTIKVNHTVIAEPDLGAKGGLRCHNRNRAMHEGETIRDIHATITCPPEQVCGRMQAESILNLVGSTKMTNERMSCIPKSLCDDTECKAIPLPPGSTKRLSCNVSCCSTNMCNRSPDGPDVPPLTEEEASRITPPINGPRGMKCLYRSEIKMGKKTLGDASSGHFCNPEEICALYVFQGIAIDFDGTRMPGSGYAAKCELESNCSQEGCRNIEQSRYIDIESCEVKCCKTTKCNRPPGYETVVSPLPTIGAVTECYDILSTKTGGISVIDDAKVTQCNILNSKCSKINMRATAPTGGVVEMAYGACVPSAMCDSLNCDDLTSSMAGITVQTCQATCCDTNLCNKKDTDTALPSKLPPMVVSGGDEKSRIKCYEMMDVKSSGVPLPVTEKRKKKFCDPGSQCMKMKAVASFNRYSTMKVTTVVGSCQPSFMCTNMDCSSMPNPMPDVTIESCEASCCDTDLCNG